jgi:hypothetical protein
VLQSRDRGEAVLTLQDGHVSGFGCIRHSIGAKPTGRLFTLSIGRIIRRFDMSRQTITPKELAHRRGISLDFIYRQLWVGKISGAQKNGKRWVIPAEATRPRGQKA